MRAQPRAQAAPQGCPLDFRTPGSGCPLPAPMAPSPGLSSPSYQPHVPTSHSTRPRSPLTRLSSESAPAPFLPWCQVLCGSHGASPSIPGTQDELSPVLQLFPKHPRLQTLPPARLPPPTPASPCPPGPAHNPAGCGSQRTRASRLRWTGIEGWTNLPASTETCVHPPCYPLPRSAPNLAG